MKFSFSFAFLSHYFVLVLVVLDKDNTTSAAHSSWAQGIFPEKSASWEFAKIWRSGDVRFRSILVCW